ncbi:MAG: hypothetical protein R3B48_09500 [Kofleriaceae bacterium]
MRADSVLRLFAVVLVLGVGACDELGPLKIGQVMASLELSIPVTVDDVATTPLTGLLVNTTKPDYQVGDHRAWKVDTLIPEATGRVTLIVEASRGANLFIELPKEVPHPAIFLTRRGQIAMGYLDPANPFPGFHGHGRQATRQLGSGRPVQRPTELRVINPVKVRIEHR